MSDSIQPQVACSMIGSYHIRGKFKLAYFLQQLINTVDVIHIKRIDHEPCLSVSGFVWLNIEHNYNSCVLLIDTLIHFCFGI